jgi:hypothetical protein
MPRLSLAYIVCLSVSCTVQCFAAQVDAKIEKTEIDNEWDRLRNLDKGFLEKSVPANSSDPATRAAVAKEFLLRADELKTFRSRELSPMQSRDVRALLAANLLYAELYGANLSRDSRDLIREARDDKASSEDTRVDISVLSDLQTLDTGRYRTYGELLAKKEDIVRSLLREFPTSPLPYELLLNVAQDSDDERAKAIASDLIDMKAPTAVVDAARIVLNRQALIGQNIRTLLSTALESKDIPPMPSGRLVILYAWSTWNEGALLLARQIGELSPPGSSIIGINLDRDTATARETATNRKLPGTHLYDPAALDSKLARQFRMTGEVLVFIAAGDGVITTVSGRLSLSDKINAAAK